MIIVRPHVLMMCEARKTNFNKINLSVENLNLSGIVIAQGQLTEVKTQLIFSLESFLQFSL